MPLRFGEARVEVGNKSAVIANERRGPRRGRRQRRSYREVSARWSYRSVIRAQLARMFGEAVAWVGDGDAAIAKFRRGGHVGR